MSSNKPSATITPPMTLLAKHRVIFSIGVALLVIIAGLIAIFWARGFKPNLQTGEIKRTGLIVASSTPTGASVYLNDRLTSATNTNIAFLDPGIYKVRIQKDGYSTWEKEILVREDLATEIKALLFPLAPEIKPLTSTGAFNPTISPSNSKIVFGVPNETGGVFVLPLVDSPFAFRQNQRQLAKNQGNFDFSKAKFIWNPNSEEFIARFEEESNQTNNNINTPSIANILLNSQDTDQPLRDITASLKSTLSSWSNLIEEQAKNLSILAPDEVKQSTAEAGLDISNKQFSSANLVNYYPNGLVFSPDEKKILYWHKEGNYRIYDLNQKVDIALPQFTDLVNISWYPDSDHLVVAQKDQISIIEADGKNKITVFSGKFENGFVFAHPNGLRLILLTSLTQPESTPPNLYSINLK